MSNINKEVGFRIREVRQERGLSQEKLAALADLHRTYIGQIERGEKHRIEELRIDSCWLIDLLQLIDQPMTQLS